MFRGIRPDLTVAQLIGLLAGGLPVFANVLRAFGVFDLSSEQEAALNDAMQWGVIIAGALFVSDAGLRSARNAAEAKIQAAAAVADAQASARQLPGDRLPDELVSDEEEFANQPPDDPDGDLYDPEER
jgi:hypothetical protein